MAAEPRPFAVVTGGSSGIGFELVRECLAYGYDVLMVADRRVEPAAAALRREAGPSQLQAMEADLSTTQGIDAVCAAVRRDGRPVALLAANAGIALHGGFLDQERDAWMKVLDTNVTGTLDLVHRLGREMRRAGSGRILITSSIAHEVPGPFNAVYNASKAFVQIFTLGLHNELQGSGVTVTALVPGVTASEYFARAGLTGTRLYRRKKDDPADVAKTGFAAALAGKASTVHARRNVLQLLAAKFAPKAMVAAAHRDVMQPYCLEQEASSSFLKKRTKKLLSVLAIGAGRSNAPSPDS